MLTKEAFYKEYLKSGDEKFPYMLLDRMRGDCDYVIEYGNTRYLWATDDPVAHIAYMRYLYDFVPIKPEWLTAEQIDDYEKKLFKKLNL